MKIKDQPLTQAEFNEGIEKLATLIGQKASTQDIEGIKTSMITKQEMEENMQLVFEAFEKVVTKEELQRVKEDIVEKLNDYATKEEMEEMLESLVERLESSVFATLRNQEKRITTLERA